MTAEPDFAAPSPTAPSSSAGQGEVAESPSPSSDDPLLLPTGPSETHVTKHLDSIRNKADESSGSGNLPEDTDLFVHQGILRCAEAIAADLERTGVLRAVLDGDNDARRRLGHTLYEQDCRGWRLVSLSRSDETNIVQY